jgi:rhamnulokinase
VTALHVVGGGCQNRTLNQLTADAAKMPVYAGPVEGTAIGNLLAQWIAVGELSGITEARALVKASLKPEEYRPRAHPPKG